MRPEDIDIVLDEEQVQALAFLFAYSRNIQHINAKSSKLAGHASNLILGKKEATYEDLEFYAMKLNRRGIVRKETGEELEPILMPEVMGHLTYEHVLEYLR